MELCVPEAIEYAQGLVCYGRLTARGAEPRLDFLNGEWCRCGAEPYIGSRPHYVRACVDASGCEFEAHLFHSDDHWYITPGAAGGGMVLCGARSDSMGPMTMDPKQWYHPTSGGGGALMPDFEFVVDGPNTEEEPFLMEVRPPLQTSGGCPFLGWSRGDGGLTTHLKHPARHSGIYIDKNARGTATPMDWCCWEKRGVTGTYKDESTKGIHKLRPLSPRGSPCLAANHPRRRSFAFPSHPEPEPFLIGPRLSAAAPDQFPLVLPLPNHHSSPLNTLLPLCSNTPPPLLQHGFPSTTSHHLAGHCHLLAPCPRPRRDAQARQARLGRPRPHPPNCSES